MQRVLNFGLKQKEEIKLILKKFPLNKTNTPFEEMRARIDGSTVTLYSSGRIVIQGKDCEKAKKLILEKMNLNEEEAVGVDETGRGEAEGPFVVGAVLGNNDCLRELRDSKKVKNLKEKFSLLTENSSAQVIVSFNASFVDRLRNKGMNLNEIESKTINKLKELFDSLDEKKEVIVDGDSLKGANPKIKFIVKGDDLEPVIGAASVLAKWFREESGDKETRKSWKK